jgi:hypothetical protein
VIGNIHSVGTDEVEGLGERAEGLAMSQPLCVKMIRYISPQFVSVDFGRQNHVILAVGKYNYSGRRRLDFVYAKPIWSR